MNLNQIEERGAPGEKPKYSPIKELTKLVINIKIEHSLIQATRKKERSQKQYKKTLQHNHKAKSAKKTAEEKQTTQIPKK